MNWLGEGGLNGQINFHEFHAKHSKALLNESTFKKNL